MKFTFIALFILIITNLFAGEISGVITDQRNRQPLAGVNVEVTGLQTGAATDQDGYFFITGLPAGSYNLSITFIGYRPVLKPNVVVRPGRTTIVNSQMQEELIAGETIVATASAFEKPKEAVVSSRSMDFEEIRRSAGSALDIQRVMQALPAVVSGSDQNNEIIIRGGIPGENLFLLDNIEIPNPNHFGEQGGGGGPINLLNTYMIRDVDFYAGAFPAKYGDRASSVMDIRQRDGASDQIKFSATLGMAGVGGLVEGPAGNSANYMFSFQKSYLDWIISSTGLTAIPQYYNTQGRIAWQLNDANRLVFNIVYGADNIKIEDEGTGGYARGAENVDYSGDQFIAGATLHSQWAKNIYSMTTVSAVQSNWNIDVYRTYNQKSYFHNYSTEGENTIKTDVIWGPTSKLELNAGLSYKNTRFDYDLHSEPDTLFLYDASGDSTVFRAYPEWNNGQKESSYKLAGNFQATWEPVNRLRLTGGLRYDYFKYNGYTSLAPRLGVSYEFARNSTVSLAYGMHYQAPSYTQLTANPLNRELKSKYTRQYVIGLEQLFGESVRMTLEAYYKRYDDVPISESMTTPDPYDYGSGWIINAAEGYARGVEFFLQKKMTKNFSMIVSYAWSQARAKDLRYNRDYDWDYDYGNVLTLIGGYKWRLYEKDWYRSVKEQTWYGFLAWLLPLADEVELGVKFRYLGGRPYTPPVYHGELKRWIVEEKQMLNTSRYPEYNRLDIRLDRRFFFDTWNMVVYFDIMNIYGRDNLWEYQYNNDGSREEILQYQVFPVGGVILEF